MFLEFRGTAEIERNPNEFVVVRWPAEKLQHGAECAIAVGDHRLVRDDLYPSREAEGHGAKRSVAIDVAWDDYLKQEFIDATAGGDCTFLDIAVNAEVPVNRHTMIERIAVDEREAYRIVSVQRD